MVYVNTYSRKQKFLTSHNDNNKWYYWYKICCCCCNCCDLPMRKSDDDSDDDTDYDDDDEKALIQKNHQDYASQKNLAKTFVDIALLTANITVLISIGKMSDIFKWISVGLATASICLIVIQSFALFILWRMSSDKKDRKKNDVPLRAKRMSNFITILALCLVIINVSLSIVSASGYTV